MECERSLFVKFFDYVFGIDKVSEFRRYKKKNVLKIVLIKELMSVSSITSVSLSRDSYLSYYYFFRSTITHSVVKESS